MVTSINRSRVVLQSSVLATVLLLIIALTCHLASQNKAYAEDVEPQLYHAQSAFAAALQKQFLKDANLAKEENFGFSALSIHTTLSMLKEGAKGRTKRQLTRALNQDTAKSQSGNSVVNPDNYRKQIDSFKDLDTEGFKFKTANSLWLQKSYKTLDSYSDLLSSSYGSQINRRDFKSDPVKVTGEINQSISENTFGLIPKLFSRPLKSATRLVLVNTVAMDAKWRSKFELLPTAKPFYYADNKSEINVPMIQMAGQDQLEDGMIPVRKPDALFGYKQTDNYQTVEIPYKGDHVSMYIVLPEYDQGSSKPYKAQLDQLLKSGKLDLTEATEGTNRMHNLESLTIPKFTLRSHIEQLIPQLKGVGIKDAFKCAKANFSGIAPGSYTKNRCVSGKSLYVSQAIHETLVHVDENGTKAAAGTGLGLTETVSITNSPTVEVDKPFLFAIKDRVTNTTFFQGWVSDPSKVAEL